MTLTAHVEGDSGGGWDGEVGVGRLAGEDLVQVLAGEGVQGEGVAGEVTVLHLHRVVQQLLLVEPGHGGSRSSCRKKRKKRRRTWVSVCGRDNLRVLLELVGEKIRVRVRQCEK